MEFMDDLIMDITMVIGKKAILLLKQQTKLQKQLLGQLHDQHQLLDQLQVQQNKSQILGFLLVMEVAIVKELKKLVKPVI